MNCRIFSIVHHRPLLYLTQVQTGGRHSCESQAPSSSYLSPMPSVPKDCPAGGKTALVQHSALLPVLVFVCIGLHS